MTRSRFTEEQMVTVLREAARTSLSHAESGLRRCCTLIGNRRLCTRAYAHLSRLHAASSYSALAPVALMTRPQRSISDLIQSANCSGVLATNSNSISRRRAAISGDCKIFTSSRW